MIVDITNEILTAIKNKLDSVNVITSFQATPSDFPTVLVEELDNSADIETKDTAGFQYSNIAFSIEIFTIGNRKMSDAKAIRNEIDVIMSEGYGLTRGTPLLLPNYLDDSVYRYRIPYTGTISKHKKIYRG